MMQLLPTPAPPKITSRMRSTSVIIIYCPSLSAAGADDDDDGYICVRGCYPSANHCLVCSMRPQFFPEIPDQIT